MFRLFGLILLIGAAYFVVQKDKVEEFKQKAIESINPAAKEKRLLGELSGNLSKFDQLIAQKDSSGLASALNQARGILEELKETNEKTDLGANLSNLIQKVVPLPAKPSPTWLPSAKECEIKK